MSENWDDYVGSVESYRQGDVADTWNEHAEQSTAALGEAEAAMAANDDALYLAAGNLGTDPAVVQESLGQAEESFQETFEHQLESLGVDPDATP